MTETLKTLLETRAEDALFSGRFQNLIVTLYENEHPPCALAGRMDWLCFGKISHFIRAGTITGKLGEVCLFPYLKRDSVYHILLLGAGPTPTPGLRKPVSAKIIQTLHKNLVSLKFSKVGISQSDFGNLDPEVLSKNLKGISMWVTQ